MSIIIRTPNPAGLLKGIQLQIESRKIETWSVDTDGDFTHAVPQWQYKAWLRPHVEAGQLRFSLLKRNDEELTKVVYGIYHGRFSEMLITHFDDSFSSLEASAQQPAYEGA